MAETPIQTLERLRPQYGTPMTRQENGALLNAFCLVQRGYAMYKKPDDNSAILPDGTRISRDIVIDLRTLKAYDTLADAEGQGRPTWNLKSDDEHTTDPSRILLPVDGPAPQPEPTPEPTPDPGPSVIERLDAIEAKLDAIAAGLRQAFADLDADVNAPRKLSGKTGGIFGASFNGTLTKE